MPLLHSASVTECRHRKRSEEHTSELQSLTNLVCRLLLEKKKEHPSTTGTTDQSIPASANNKAHQCNRAGAPNRLDQDEERQALYEHCPLLHFRRAAHGSV